MSTTLTPISGKQEYISSVEKKEVGHRDSQLHLKAFSGGAKRGTCIQLGLDGGDHIQFTKTDAIRLRDELTRFIEGKY